MQPRNVRMVIGSFCCAAIMGLLGCASLARPLPGRKPTNVYASFGKTWSATMDYFAQSGRSVDTTDRSSGIIRADATTMPRDKSHLGLCGNSHVESYWGGEHGGWHLTRVYEVPPVGAPFIAVVRGDSTRATVSVTSQWMDLEGKKINCSTSSKTSWEQQSEATIQTRAERR